MMTAAEPLRPVYVEWADRLERLLRLSAFPLAVKMCEKDEEIPELAGSHALSRGSQGLRDSTKVGK